MKVKRGNRKSRKKGRSEKVEIRAKKGRKGEREKEGKNERDRKKEDINKLLVSQILSSNKAIPRH
jgi:hypothetical protein